MEPSLLIVPELAGRRCIIVGSAPGLRLPHAKSGDIILGANSGAPIAREQGRDVYGLLTTSYLFLHQNKAHDHITLASLAGLEVDTIWLDIRGGGEPRIRNALKNLHIQYRCLIEVEHAERRRLLSSCGAAPTWVSTGVWAACLALASDASEVIVAGVSLRRGYFDQPWDRARRWHMDEDRQCLRDLHARLKTTSKDLAKATGMEYLDG